MQFLSPLHSKTQASFIISLKKNRWYDHGLGQGENVIDLVVAMNLCSVREALDLLSEIKISFFRQHPLLVMPEKSSLFKDKAHQPSCTEQLSKGTMYSASGSQNLLS